jgi:hypothetical protein
MSYTKGKSGLTLPVKTGKVSKRRDMTIQFIEEWRSQLPLSDLAASAKSLYLTLQDSHQAPLSAKERFEILSLLQSTVSYICQALQKYYFTQEVVNEQQRNIADLVNAIYFEMINGYKLCIEAVCNQLLPNQQILIGSLQKAISYCCKIIFHSYEQHRAPPDGIWLELHTLYNFAHKKNVVHKGLKKYLQWQCRLNTLADIYKHCLLFSIANPNHLRRSQITQLISALEAWAPLLIMKDIDKTSSSLFVVDFLYDSPPRYTGLFPKPPENCYFLNLQHVNERLMKLLLAQGTTNNDKLLKLFTPSELALSHAYIESILNAWKNIRERAYERISTQGKMSVCLGISACHWHLTESVALKTYPDVANKDEIEINVLSSLQDKGSHPKYPMFECELINQSNRGYCLKWLEEIPLQLQSGEIIGLIAKNDSAEQILSIGTIRWIKHEENNVLLIGVELLSLDALPIKARLTETTSQYAVPTLVFPENLEKHKPMTIVTPPLPFKTGNEIEIEYENQTYTANLQKNYSDTPSYQEFGLHFAYQQLVFAPSRNTDEITSLAHANQDSTKIR